MLLLDPVLPGVLLDPSDSSGSRFSSPYPVPEPVELPRDGLVPPVDPLDLPNDPPCPPDPLIPLELLVFADPEREPLSLFSDPLELRDEPDEPDEPWSFLFRSFAIRPPALSGALITLMNLCGAMPPLRARKKQHSRHFIFFMQRLPRQDSRRSVRYRTYMGAHTSGRFFEGLPK